MENRKLYKIISFLMIFVISICFISNHVVGEVKSITDMQDKMENTSKKEKEVLGKLFIITQEIDQLEKDEISFTAEIASLQDEINVLGKKMNHKQKDYDFQRNIMKQVLVRYQRGGPATYLEILLKAENFTSFLKSINMIKDISHNVKQLLASLKEEKQTLNNDREKLSGEVQLLKKKKKEQEKTLRDKLRLQKEQETYLSTLHEESAYYKDQLGNLNSMWEDCQVVFQDMVKEITKTISDGYFTVADLNLSSGITNMEGTLSDETFNSILKNHTTLSETIIHFEENQVIIDIPEKHLSLHGNFIIKGKTAIQFQAVQGSFYDMPLQKESISELFKNRPLVFDFKKMMGDMLYQLFTIQKVDSHKGNLAFHLKIDF